MVRSGKVGKAKKSGPQNASGSIEVTAHELSEIELQYRNSLARNEALRDEVTFILSERLNSSEIKIHGIERRVKTLDSVLQKCKSRGIRRFKELNDIVGARVVCLFRSDMVRVGELIDRNFDVVRVDDKLATAANPLGYTSCHYLCRMPARYQGPRYENTSDVVFEIQVRTLCMHAWAAVSHYLDYKGDWDVPSDLKQALSALSGLFFVADNQFEQFYAARVASQRTAESPSQSAKNQDINLDTMTAFLRSRFGDRRIDSASVSELVQLVKEAGITSMDEVSSAVERSVSSFEEYEKRDPPTVRNEEGGPDRKGRYSAMGAARLSLAMSLPSFFKVHKDNEGLDDFEDLRARRS